MIIETLLFLVIFSLGAGMGGAVIYAMIKYGIIDINDDEPKGGSGELKSA